MFLFIFVLFYVGSVKCDVFSGNQPFQYLAPPFENNFEVVNRPLPEIVINKQVDTNNLVRDQLSGGGGREEEGYVYDKPNNQYLTPIFPPQSDTPVDVYLPPQALFPPLSDEEYNPPPSLDYPSNDYLPSLVRSAQNEVLINFPERNKSIEKQDKRILLRTSQGLSQTQNGYNYQPPPSADEEQPSGYVYNPPTTKSPIQPSSTYLPPTLSNTIQGRFLKEQSLHGPLRLELKELRCLNQIGGYFRTILVVHSFLDNIPIVDIETIDSRCSINVVRSQLVLNINFVDFTKCGVQLCGQDLCLRLRFPQIRGMKTNTDSILTLQCKVQERIVAKTHSLKLGLSELSQKRSGGTFAQGGSQQPFRTQVALFRRSGNGADSSLEPGGIVQLGEDLILRAHVNSGDGWNFTRISDVSLQRLASSGEIINSATLISSLGCVNPLMRSVCPQAPLFEPPLGHRLGFKAIMFQGMKSGDEMTMTIRVIACIEKRDCLVDSHQCDKLTGREKRNVLASDQLSEISRLSFRIEIPGTTNATEKSFFSRPMLLIVITGTLCFICLIALIGFFIKNRKKFFK